MVRVRGYDKARGSAVLSAPGPTLTGERQIGPEGFTLILDEQWTSGSVDTSRWYIENSTYGSPQRYGRWTRRPENIYVSAASTGATGNSLKLSARKEFYIDREYTGGMISTRDVQVWYPKFGRYEIRLRTPHGQGWWPAFWLRHRDGANVCEPDILEYFHAETPGMARITLHRMGPSGSVQINVHKVSAFFEDPTIAVPEWHTFAMEIIPATYNGQRSATFIGYIDGVEKYRYTDTYAQSWIDRYNNDEDRVWDITIQGGQIGGPFIGHPEDPLGYSRNRHEGGVTGGEVGGCILGGTAPNSCTTSYQGRSTQPWPGPTPTLEVDYVRVWRYDG